VENYGLKIHSPIIEECRNGSIRSQYRLYNLYAKAMYNTACRILNNREDAEDILQEAFSDCFANIGSFRYESTFGAWLKSIVINKSINFMRRRKPDLVFSDNLPEMNEPEEIPEPKFSHPAILNAIAKLPDGYRTVLTLYLLEGYDHEEIAIILGISENTSKTQYLRAKDKLRKIIINENPSR